MAHFGFGHRPCRAMFTKTRAFLLVYSNRLSQIFALNQQIQAIILQIYTLFFLQTNFNNNLLKTKPFIFQKQHVGLEKRLRMR